MEITDLDNKFKSLWGIVFPVLKNAREGDLKHSKEVVEMILKYHGNFDIDLDVIIPVAMMHDIGHAMILQEHFHYVTGGDKLKNGKLVHMLAGAKMAYDILKKVKYDESKIEEIVEIISTHDFDQIEGIDISNIFNSENKKFFHDLDSLDRFNQKRLEPFLKTMGKDKISGLLNKTIDNMFFEEFKLIANKLLNNLEL